ncbi:type IX secretion system protein PorD [Reichenbachiella versicolor]|uniref:type IX secretion system protein PorD n=1 Tax=Reichenbachiella versicolor TaxID=1821036 RepID=UPI0013A58A0D|nr:DUF4835 family protein [Reichenbachiella versicolor]
MKINLFLLLLLIASSVSAQELICKVKINSQQIQTTERLVFDEMEKALEDFINDRTWTDDRYENQEKIKCVFQLTLESSPEIGRYVASAQVISIRPVYNTTYETTLINFADREFEFRYIEGQPLIFNESGFSDNLTSLLGYYANMILAYDYDSFALNGGDQYYDRAWSIVTAAQGQGFSGWDQFSNIRNRYWWVNDIQNQVMTDFRVAIYEYHRKGIDLMQQDEEKARVNVLEALRKIQTVNRAKPRSILVIGFIDAKKDELVNVFSKGDMGIRREAFDILKQIDPARAKDFQKIMSN